MPPRLMRHAQWRKRCDMILMAAIASLFVQQFDFDQRRQSIHLFGQQFEHIIHGEKAF